MALRLELAVAVPGRRRAASIHEQAGLDGGTPIWFISRVVHGVLPLVRTNGGNRVAGLESLPLAVLMRRAPAAR